ncbi:TIGR02679 domain-containing protein [Actinokineospora sp. G85]|uniref:TIGR02679 domain-containing protein n=1 Tax=Actinokineospora sp. G85 TaxID=3406626 RepID=UPI003C724520
MSALAEVYGRPEYVVLWRKALAAVRRGQARFGYKAPDPAAATAVSELLGVPVTAGIGMTFPVEELDALLRASSLRCGLTEVLAAVHGEEVVAGEASPSRDEWVDELLRDALTTAGLSAAPWASVWVDQVRRYAKIAPERLAGPAVEAAAVLARINLDPGVVPTVWVPRAELAGVGLDRGRKLAALVLRAAALAHGVPLPRGAEAERRLWERCGVAVDGLSSTVVWRGSVVALRDVATVPVVPPGSVVWVCSSPRLAEVAGPVDLVCLAGRLGVAARMLLARLASLRVDLRVHGDFDAAGLLVVREVLSLTGGTPWRMGADDYRSALDLARSEGIDLPPLDGEVGPTPWDPRLGDALRAGWSVPEEMLLDLLIPDLV